MSTLLPDSESAGFESAVRQRFAFLEADYGFCFAGTRDVNEDPRDSYVVARYRHGEIRIDVAWNAMAESLGVLIRLDTDTLKRKERYVYLEPFIEFTSNGAVTPLVPQIYPGMSVGRIEESMRLRDEVFRDGIDEPLNALASRLREHYLAICGASPDAVREYHQWYQSRGKTA